MQDFGTLLGIDLGAVAVTAGALLVFGTAYNWVVTEISRRGYDDGFTWLLVIIGVLVTVIMAGFTIGWPAVILLGIYFSASGLPMAAGDIWRHVRARRVERND